MYNVVNGLCEFALNQSKLNNSAQRKGAVMNNTNITITFDNTEMVGDKIRNAIMWERRVYANGHKVGILRQKETPRGRGKFSAVIVGDGHYDIADNLDDAKSEVCKIVAASKYINGEGKPCLGGQS